MANPDFHPLVFWLVSWPVGVFTGHFPAPGRTPPLASLPPRLADEMLCSPGSCYQCNNLQETADLIFWGGILMLLPTGAYGFSGSSGFSSVLSPLLLSRLCSPFFALLVSQLSPMSPRLVFLIHSLLHSDFHQLKTQVFEILTLSVFRLPREQLDHPLVSRRVMPLLNRRRVRFSGGWARRHSSARDAGGSAGAR